MFYISPIYENTTWYVASPGVASPGKWYDNW